MSDGQEPRSYLIDMDRLPVLFPTHRHTAEFWEHLGRAVATFGFLEEIMGKAIFAFTATTRYAPEDVEAAYQAWLPKLEKALTDTLPFLADAYKKAVDENPAARTEDVGGLSEKIKEAAKLRNVLCHGSWHPPEEDGSCRVFYVDRRLGLFDQPVDIEWLRDVQAHVAELACHVMNSVTAMGVQFPGSSGPGTSIWPNSR
nr:conserved uncharacterized protein [uncultured bacterium]